MIDAAKQAIAASDISSLPVHSFSELVDMHGDAIYKFCRSLAYSKEEADDLYQETFLKALEKYPTMKNVKNPQGFLFSVTIYLWRSWKRKHAIRDRIAPAQPLNENIEYNADMENHIIAKEDNCVVWAVVDDLPEKFKIPVLLHYSVGI